MEPTFSAKLEEQTKTNTRDKAYFVSEKTGADQDGQEKRRENKVPKGDAGVVDGPAATTQGVHVFRWDLLRRIAKQWALTVLSTIAGQSPTLPSEQEKTNQRGLSPRRLQRPSLDSPRRVPQARKRFSKGLFPCLSLKTTT